MHIKIQGGGEGKYSNAGSCSSLISYLEHEDLERQTQGTELEYFFSHSDDNVNSDEIINMIDNNKQKLCRDEAKFFVLTFSPSDKELNFLGSSEKERSEKIKDFVRNGLMEKYAENFNKNLTAKDIMYFGKIHHERNNKTNKIDLHCHIVVSRKTMNGKIKISPKTNHKNTTSGAVKGGFVRTDFYKRSEKAFDSMFIFPRLLEETFEYKNRMKKAKVKEIIELENEKFLKNNENEKQLQKMISDCKRLGFTNEKISLLLKGKSIFLEKGEHNIKDIDKKDFIKIGIVDGKFELLLNDKVIKNLNQIIVNELKEEKAKNMKIR